MRFAKSDRENIGPNFRMCADGRGFGYVRCERGSALTITGSEAEVMKEAHDRSERRAGPMPSN